MDQSEPEKGNARQFDSADPNLSGTGDEGLAPTNSASNIIPPGVRKQFAQAREASVHAFQNVSSKVEQAANSEKGQKIQEDLHHGFEKIGQAAQNCWNWTREHVEPAAKEFGEFGEGKTRPHQGFNDGSHEQQIENISSSGHHAQDIDFPERTAADVIPESSSNLVQTDDK